MTTDARSIRVAGLDDARMAGEILADGFAADPVMSWVFARDPGRTLPVFFEFVVRELMVELGATYLSSDCCAVWVPPDINPWDKPGASDRFIETVVPVADDKDIERLMILGDATEAAHPSDSHYYLSMLATRVAAQGRGAGGQMLRHNLALVDEQRAPAYLESTNPRNVSLYERHGFVVTGQIQLPGGPGLTQMWREAADALSAKA